MHVGLDDGDHLLGEGGRVDDVHLGYPQRVGDPARRQHLLQGHVYELGAVDRGEMGAVADDDVGGERGLLVHPYVVWKIEGIRERFGRV